MKTNMLRTLLRLARHVVHAVLGGLLVLIGVAVYVLDSRPDLHPWHQVRLDAEFTVKSEVTDFRGYVELERRLFDQLEKKVYEQVRAEPGSSLNRYVRGSLSDPGRWPSNWNRSYELRPKEPVASVLLLHGLSDSPYSLQAIGASLHERGAAVLGLRVPGHGTVPSALIDTTWQDMAAAVRLAVRHLHEAAGDKPIYLIGYSNGGALSVEYTLSALEDPELPVPDGIVLLSPEIGVTPAAVLARWQARLGRVLGLSKLAWSSILPEYDPFKYNSFPIGAGDLAYRITERIQEHLDALESSGKLAQMPPILAFQSSVDATVSAPALVEHLFARLEPPGHELVLFDINRLPDVVALLTRDPRDVFEPIMKRIHRGFTLTLVTSDDPQSRTVVARTLVHGDEQEKRVELDARWPLGVYSLGHIALPFSPMDPLYGGRDAPESPGVKLGHAELRGETGALLVSPKALMRQHWNPFFDYVKTRLVEFMNLTAAPQ